MRRIALLLVALVVALSSVAAEGHITVFLVGDSTCATKKLDKQNPERGWGHMFQPFFDEGVVVENHAVNGRSTKSFRSEGRWDKVIERMEDNDYVFIEFGHNDAKVNDPSRYSSPDEYAENLRRFVFEVRSHGGIPVLLTPIVRRHWQDGVLLDTHGKYLSAMKRVADEEEVMLFDMEKVTRKWVAEMGDELSRQYFMNVPAGICPLYPDGKIDNTHLNVRGAKQVARFVISFIKDNLPRLASHIVEYDFVVAKDGSGDFFTLQEMVNALPDFSRKEIKVLIRKGIYKEKISIPWSKRYLTLIGESRNESIITYDAYASMPNAVGENTGTSGSSTFYVCCDDFRAENLTFENSAGSVGQAVAMQCIGDKILFVNCRFLGNQDTLYLHGHGNRDGKEYLPNSRICLVDCYVEGTTDFIFGSATALFVNCRIHSKSNSYVTAASTCEGQKYGFVFRGCSFTADDGVDRVYLGRPWRNYARTVMIDCHMASHILPCGWHNWKKPQAEKTTLYAEWNSTGDGAAAESRVKWAKRLSAKQVERDYNSTAVLAGGDGWNPLQE